MQLETIEELVEVLHGSTLTRLEVEGDGWALSLEQPPAAPAPAPVAPAPAPAPAPASAVAAAPMATGGKAVEAPMVGVFHEAAAPVTTGQTVRAGDPLGAIEALALRNDVRAPVDGEVLEVAVEEGQPVEYGQVMFVIAPAEDGA